MNDYPNQPGYPPHGQQQGQGDPPQQGGGYDPNRGYPPQQPGHDPNYPPPDPYGQQGYAPQGQGQPGYPPQGQPYHPGHPPQGQPYDQGYAPGAYPPNQADPYAQPGYGQPPYGPPPGGGRSALPFIIGGVLLVIVIGIVLTVVVNRGARGGADRSAAATSSASAPAAAEGTAPAAPPVGGGTVTTPQGTVALDQVAQINQAAQQIVALVSPRLPVQVSYLTLTDITWLVGSGVKLTGTVNREMSSSDWDVVQGEIKRELCTNGYDQLTRVGGSVRVDLADPIGNTSTLIWRDC